jgi:hypothetical protein
MTTKRRPQLHEVLAVEQELKGKAESARAQTTETFHTQQNHFCGMRRTFRPFAVEEQEASGERLEAETNLATTVPEELAKLLATVGEAIDLGYQIDEANTRARADVVVGDRTIAADVPATFLLQLERRLRELRAVFREAPCYDPVRLWSPDPSAEKKHVMRAEPVVTIRKQKTRKYKVTYEATKEHPAQVDIFEVDEPVGEIRSYEWTGMLATGARSAMIERIDQLLAAVKQARSRANTVEVDTQRRIAHAMVDFLLEPVRG